ncbi:MAG: hypothetical protein ACKO04_05000 [Actinomycetes bacterium]
MISMDRTTTADRDSLSADELSTRLPETLVTRVPQGPRGLWEALAAAATRRHRAEVAQVVSRLAGLPVVDVRASGPADADRSGRAALAPVADGLLVTLGVDVVPLPG